MIKSLAAKVVVMSFALTGLAFAQAFPTKPVLIVVPFSAGGTLDAVARVVGGKLADYLGQPVVIENRTGAGGIIGYQQVSKSPPDGHTLVTIANSFAVNPAVRNDLPYDSVRHRLVVK